MKAVGCSWDNPGDNQSMINVCLPFHSLNNIAFQQPTLNSLHLYVFQPALRSPAECTCTLRHNRSFIKGHCTAQTTCTASFPQHHNLLYLNNIFTHTLLVVLEVFELNAQSVAVNQRLADCATATSYTQWFSVIFITFFFSGWIAGIVRGEKCNSSGQTLIFSLSFHPVTRFVDITHSSDIVLGSMDFCLRCRGILSLEEQSAGETWKTGEERHQISLIFLKTVPNALLKS